MWEIIKFYKWMKLTILRCFLVFFLSMPMLSSARTAPITAMNKVFKTGAKATKKSFKKFIIVLWYYFLLCETIPAFK